MFIYYKKKDYIPIVMAINFLFVLELAFFFLFGTIFNLLTSGLFSSQRLSKEVFMTISISILVSLYTYNVLRYLKRGKTQSIILQFENSSLNHKIRTWQIFILPILIVIFSITLIVVIKS